jgi:hypothetical protein
VSCDPVCNNGHQDKIAWEWMIVSNEVRPHDALGKVSPTVFRKKVEAETLL